MRPADVLAYRAILVDDLRRPRSAETLARRTLDESSTIETEIDELASFVPHCDCYFVTADMTALAIHAAKSMPWVTFRADELPSTEGFMVFDGPVAHRQDGDTDGTVDVSVFAWTLAKDVHIWDMTEEDTDLLGLDRDRVGQKMSKTKNQEYPRSPDEIRDVIYLYDFARYKSYLVPLGAFRVWVDTAEHDDAPSYETNPLVVLRAAWNIMSETLPGRSLVEVMPTRVDRPTRRRLKRASLPDALLVVRLRRYAQPVPDREGVMPVDWSHRWLVTGHWRNQWVPSLGGHRLQWIHPYVKGPNDRPLVLKNRVTAWVR
jgi:hypothetical protein